MYTREELIEAILLEAYGTGTVRATQEKILKSQKIGRAFKTRNADPSDIRAAYKLVDKAYTRQFKAKWKRKSRVI